MVGFYTITIILNLIKVFSIASLTGKELIIGKNFITEVYILDAVIVLVIMQLIAMHTKKLILNNTPWKRILLLHFFLAIFIGVIIQGITDIYRIRVGFFKEFDIRESLKIFLNVMDINFLVYFAMLFIIYTYYYFDIIRANEIKQNQLEAQLMSTKMNLLKTQLQPHFLFNTINCIIGLIDVDKRKAQDTLVDLSSLFREFTKVSSLNTHSLEREMEILNHYIEILKVRFPENLNISIDMDASILNKEIPTLLFQPLIENAINHGYDRTKGDFFIRLKGYSQNGQLIFVVENNGPSLEENTSTSQTGVGISNLKQRLSNLYGDKAQFLLKNKDNAKGVENIIFLPN